MASLAIIQYDPDRAIANRRPRKPSFLPSNTPRSHERGSHGRNQSQACTQNSKEGDAPIFVGRSKEVIDEEKELDSLFDEIDGIVGIENGFAKASAEHEVGAQDGDEEFGANNTMRGDCNLLKLKPKTGGQGSEDNPLVITDDECHGDGDSESEDDLVWKKRRVDRVSWFKTIGETDEETDDEAEISCTGVRADDTGSESDSIVGRLEDFASASADLVESQPVARVGDNGEWGIHGIIGKEIIDGVLHYCVDWEPTMLPVGVLRGAWRMVQEFEAKEQARSGKGGDSRKRKRVRRGRQ